MRRRILGLVFALTGSLIGLIASLSSGLTALFRPFLFFLLYGKFINAGRTSTFNPEETFR